MQALDAATPSSALRLGLILSVPNPKVALLAVASGLTIGAAELGSTQAVAATAVFTAVASCSVAAPLVAYLLLGERVLQPLGRARDWLRAHQAAVVAAVLALIGLLLIAQGIATI